MLEEVSFSGQVILSEMYTYICICYRFLPVQVRPRAILCNLSNTLDNIEHVVGANDLGICRKAQTPLFYLPEVQVVPGAVVVIMTHLFVARATGVHLRTTIGEINMFYILTVSFSSDRV